MRFKLDDNMSRVYRGFRLVKAPITQGRKLCVESKISDTQQKGGCQPPFNYTELLCYFVNCHTTESIVCSTKQSNCLSRAAFLNKERPQALSKPVPPNWVEYLPYTLSFRHFYLIIPYVYKQNKRTDVTI